MDTRTGQTYPSFNAAVDAGVPTNNIALRDEQGHYVVQNGPFKGRVYRLNERGQSVRDREAERTCRRAAQPGPSTTEA